jgi:hypothetical protein
VTIHIFTGPTLTAEEGRQEIEAFFLPPAEQGDIYRSTLKRPVAIGLIDGYFEHVPAVSHKEILWAMSQGVHVFGAASMGALRAAELALFGMEGVGVVYEAYARGELDADDEVAVIHGSGEEAYRPASEAMVNIRATLRAAEQRGVLGAESREALERIAKRLFYADRCYPRLLSSAAEEGLASTELKAFQVFLKESSVNQKRLDALAMLRLMRERFAGPSEPKKVSWHFEHTDAWEYIRTSSVRNIVDPGMHAANQAAGESP